MVSMLISIIVSSQEPRLFKKQVGEHRYADFLWHFIHPDRRDKLGGRVFDKRREYKSEFDRLFYQINTYHQLFIDSRDDPRGNIDAFSQEKYVFDFFIDFDLEFQFDLRHSFRSNLYRYLFSTDRLTCLPRDSSFYLCEICKTITKNELLFLFNRKRSSFFFLKRTCAYR